MKLTWILVITVLVVFANAAPDYYRSRQPNRYSSWSNYGSGRSYHSDRTSRHRSGYRRKNTSKVIMPSGANAAIIKPRGTICIRNNDSALVLLTAANKRWKDEFALVKQEMEITNNRGLTFNILKIEKIFNNCLWQKYSYRRNVVYEEAHKTNERMLFHGSPVAKDIALHGFDERYASLSGFFGAGVYFADRSSKSNDYARPQADRTRTMLLCRVTLGNEHKMVASGSQFAHAPVGFQSVVGTPTANSDTEYIVYRAEQAYPAFLITYTT